MRRGNRAGFVKRHADMLTINHAQIKTSGIRGFMHRRSIGNFHRHGVEPRVIDHGHARGLERCSESRRNRVYARSDAF